MSIESLDQLFSHELKDIYAEEQALIKAHDTFSTEELHDELQQIFHQHREETKQHVERLEDVFEELGEQPESEGGQAAAGLMEEHESFKEDEPTDQIHAAYDIVAGKKVEKYEITAYENLLEMAEAMELSENVQESLQSNLSDEREQLDRLQNASQDTDLEQLQQQDQTGPTHAETDGNQ